MRWKLLIAIAAVVAAAVFFTVNYLDPIVKKKIETVGTERVGAKVSLDRLEISIKNQSIKITGLQVANPDDPWKNIFELKSATVDFSLPYLLLKRVVIGDISVDSPVWGSKRKTFGGITAQKKTPAPVSAGLNIDWKKYLPAGDLMKKFDPKKLVNPETMKSLKQLDDIRGFAQGRDKYWKNRLKELEKSFNEVKASPSPLKVKKLIDDIKSARSELQKDIDRVNGVTRLVNGLRNGDIQKALEAVGIGGGNVGEITQKMFSGVYRKQIEKVYNKARAVRAKLSGTGEEAEKKKRMRGVTVEYPLKNPVPRFYVKKAIFKTSAENRTGNWFDGEISEISSDPKLTGKPVDIAIEGGAQDMPGAYFGLKGKIDLAKKQGVYSFNLKGDEIPVSIIENMLGAGSPLGIKGGSTVFNIGLDMEGDYISSYFLVMIKNIRLSARPEGLKEVDESLVRILNDSVKNINHISFKGKASGDLKNLQISVSSDIDNILNRVFAKAVANARAEAERRIRKELDREIGERVPEIKKLLTDDSGKLASLDSLAGSVRKQLEKRVQKEIEKRRKKAEKSLQKELGKQMNKALKNFKFSF